VRFFLNSLLVEKSQKTWEVQKSCQSQKFAKNLSKLLRLTRIFKINFDSIETNMDIAKVLGFNFLVEPTCAYCDYFKENTIKSQTSQGWLKSIDKLTTFELQNVNKNKIIILNFMCLINIIFFSIKTFKVN
jgi:hypothetical protein